MEILAVLLVIAVVVSMAAPVFRAVRYDIKNSQAKKAAKSMAEAMRSYYQISRGLGIKMGCFNPSTDTNVIMAESSECESPAADGIPYQNANLLDSARSNISQLFACGYLSYKDFASLPYEFCTCSLTGGYSSKCDIPEATSTNKPFVVVRGKDGAGDKYTKSDYYIYVDRAMQTYDTED